MTSKIGITAGFFELLGRKLYSNPTAQILPRELLQNAVDACRGIQNPHIAITIEIQKEGYLISCDDNGCGMDLEVLDGKFLQVGGTTKNNDPTATGKFGVAKVSIMVNPQWSCWTHDLYVDQRVFDGMDIEHREWRQGTRISALVKEDIRDTVIMRIVRDIYMSAVDIELTISKGNYVFNDLHAGTHFDTKQKLWKKGKMTAYAIKGTHFPDISQLLSFPHQLAEAQSIVSLNGLAQYQLNTTDKRTTTLLFDISGISVANSTDNLFSLSREDLSYGDEKQAMIDELDKHNTSPKMTEIQMDMRKQTSPWMRSAGNPIIPLKFRQTNIVIHYGTTVHAQLPPSQGYTQRGQIFSISMEQAIKLVFSGTAEFATQADHAEVEKAINEVRGFIPSSVAPVSNLPLVMHYMYTGKLTKKDMGVLRLWKALLEIVSEDNEGFGMGLSGYENHEAMRNTDQGTPIYVINPKKVAQYGDKRAYVINLLRTSCHECAHKLSNQHDEEFLLEQDRLFEGGLEEVMKRMKELTSLL